MWILWRAQPGVPAGSLFALLHQALHVKAEQLHIHLFQLTRGAVCPSAETTA